MRPLFGCVLAGGESKRMGTPKALLEVGGKSFLERTVELLGTVTSQVFISVGSPAGRAPGPSRRQETAIDRPHPVLYDSVPGGGPLSGIAAALQSRSDVAWLFVAVDMPLLTRETLTQLVETRCDAGRRSRSGRGASGPQVTAFRSPHTRGPEPLCSIWEPDALAVVLDCMKGGERSVTRCLERLEVRLVAPVDERALRNANTPADLKSLTGHLVSPAGTT